MPNSASHLQHIAPANISAAQDIVAAAEEKAAQIVAEAEQVAESIRQQALAETIADSVIRETTVRNASPELVALVCSLVEEVVELALDSRPEIVAHQVQKALTQIPTAVRVECTPQIANRLQQLLQ